jgi:hypothetical protein
MDQPRIKGKFAQKETERRGDAIALRLPASLDAQVREAAGWQSGADNTALRDWVEGACKLRVNGGTFSALERGYTPQQVRAAANRVAVRVPIKNRAAVIKAFDALIGELLSGD